MLDHALRSTRVHLPLPLCSVPSVVWKFYAGIIQAGIIQHYSTGMIRASFEMKFLNVFLEKLGT